MNLVDNKGRLFGIINLIDLAVLLLIAAVVLSVSANFMANPAKKAEVADRQQGKMSVDIIEAKVIFPNVIKSVVEDPNVLIPGSVVNNNNISIVKVLEIMDLPKDARGIDYCNVTVLMRIKCVNLLGDYYCNNTPIKINYPNTLTISNSYYALYNGIVLGMRLVSNE